MKKHSLDENLIASDETKTANAEVIAAVFALIKDELVKEKSVSKRKVLERMYFFGQSSKDLLSDPGETQSKRERDKYSRWSREFQAKITSICEEQGWSIN